MFPGKWFFTSMWNIATPVYGESIRPLNNQRPRPGLATLYQLFSGQKSTAKPNKCNAGERLNQVDSLRSWYLTTEAPFFSSPPARKFASGEVLSTPHQSPHGSPARVPKQHHSRASRRSRVNERWSPGSLEERLKTAEPRTSVSYACYQVDRIYFHFGYHE